MTITLDRTYDGFVRSGALLDEAGKQRLRELSEKGSLLALQFSQNLLKDTKAFTLLITDKNDLAGLPDTAVEAAANAAKEQGKEDWLFTLDYPSYSPFMSHADNRELRRQLYMARNTLCTHGDENDNRDICRALVNNRRVQAYR